MSDEPLFFITHGMTLIISGSTGFLFINAPASAASENNTVVN